MPRPAPDPVLETYLADRERLISLACRVVESPMIAEEIVQESWLRWHGRGYPERDARPLFRRIVANLARDWRRSRRTELRALPDLIALSADMPSSERAAIARDELRRVVAALDGLPARTRQAFRLRFVDGLSYRQIGARLGISRSRSHALAEDALVEITVALGR